MNREIRLKVERVKREWTQEFVSQKLGVSPQAVCDWEKGRRFPRQPVLNKLEDLFNLPHRELFAAAYDEKTFPSTN